MSKIADLMLMAAGGAGGGPPEYIGSVTKSARYDFYWDSNEPADVLSVAQTGDLVVMALTASRNTTGEIFEFGGMSFQTASAYFEWNDFIHAQIGYRVVQSGDSNPYITFPDDRARGISAVFSVFRGPTGITDSVNPTNDNGYGHYPDPPSWQSNGTQSSMHIVTAHGAEDADTFSVMPSGYTLAAQQTQDYLSDDTSTALAYKIEPDNVENPSTFTWSGYGEHVAFTAGFL